MADNIRFYIRRLKSNGDFIKAKYVTPHYKSLKKTYKKESNQMFFREALDGKFIVYGDDYNFIVESSLEDKFQLIVYKAINAYVLADFNKSDCIINHSKCSVEIKLTYHDKYTNILDKYENTYDLLKIAPEITQLTLTKRSIVQIYIRGAETISSFSGGTYWETDVNEVIDSEDALKKKYYFAKGPTFAEIYFEDDQNSKICPSIRLQNGITYAMTSDKDTWTPTPIPDGVMAYIKFLKVASKGDAASKEGGYLLSSGKTGTVAEYEGSNVWKYIYDIYQIQFWSNYNTGGTTTLVAQSVNNYANDNDSFILSIGEGLYEIKQNIEGYGNFNLGEYTINYDVWGRLLCDALVARDGTELYDLPYDDFAIERANYKRCIGLRFVDGTTTVCSVRQSINKSNTPNCYGHDDNKKYFMPPNLLLKWYPVSRNSWANTSLWISFNDAGAGVAYDFETWNSQFYKTYRLKNAYHIGDVISKLLSEIDTSITHDKTSEYSQFLYGQTSGVTRGALSGCQIYITPKSNILKGQYDQAAQKAEITLKQILDMLRDCYRCYWYIDSNNKLIIEHVSYFINGLTYTTNSGQTDLTKYTDRFNSKSVLYGQRELSFEKSELYSRYEFAWCDDVTDAMGNLHVDVNNNYVKKDNKQDISISGFCPDIDYMLFMPSDFSSDDFALLMANANNKVPILRTYILDEKFYNSRMLVAVQNWYASWNNLIEHYMMDMPGNDISCNNVQYTPRVIQVKRCIKQEISLKSDIEPYIYHTIKTDEGVGYIEEMSVELNTGVCDITLMYRP